MAKENDTADRELRISRVLNAPIDLVWEVWTNPEHLKHWWGPDGFTNTITRMEMRKGGQWNLVMHGPDGKDYSNESIIVDIVKYKRIVYDHVSGPRFLATIEFEPQGNKTRIEWSMVFETKEQLIRTVKTVKADEGLKQNVVRMEQYMLNMQTANK